MDFNQHKIMIKCNFTLQLNWNKIAMKLSFLHDLAVCINEFWIFKNVNISYLGYVLVTDMQIPLPQKEQFLFFGPK